MASMKITLDSMNKHDDHMLNQPLEDSNSKLIKFDPNNDRKFEVVPPIEGFVYRPPRRRDSVRDWDYMTEMKKL